MGEGFKISFELLVTIVVAIVLILLDKAGKLHGGVALLLLTIMAVCAVAPIVTAAPSRRVPKLRGAAVIIVLLLTSWFGIWLWPGLSGREKINDKVAVGLSTQKQAPSAQPPPVGATTTIAVPLPQKKRAAPRGKSPLPPQQISPLFANIRLASVRQVVSTEAKYPYQLEIIIQTDRALSPAGFVFVCDSPIGRAYGRPNDLDGGAFAGMIDDIPKDHPNMFVFGWDSPPFTPSSNLVVRILADHPIQLLRWHVKGEPRDRPVADASKEPPSQTMVNSPGSTQVGGNLTINNKPPERTITAETAKQMMAVLGTVPPNAVGFTYVAGDLESIHFANRLADIFKVAGWRIVDMGGAMHMSRPVGLHITPATDTPGDTTGLAIKAALELAGGPVGYSDGTKHVGADTCRCYLIIVNYAP